MIGLLAGLFLIISFSSSNLSPVVALKLCCQGENEILQPGNQCANGKPLDISPCHKYIFPKNETEATVDGDDNLIIEDDDPLPPDKYCYAELTSKTATKLEVYIICIPEEDLEQQNPVMGIFILIFQMISVIFFFLTIIVYLMIPQMLDLQGICTIHSILGLMIGYIVLISENLSVSQNGIKCHMVAYSLYTSFLYAFFWLNLCCFNMWRLVVKPKLFQKIHHLKLFYHLYGIGGPLLLLLFLATIHHWNLPMLKSIHPGLTEGRCWFKSMRESLIYLYAPISILLAMNIIYFMWTGYVLWNQTKACTKTSVMKYRLRLYFTLFFVMGIEWIFEVLSAAVEYFNDSLEWLWFITDSLNALVGVIIFIILVVLRKKVLRGLANRSFFGTFIRFPAHWKYAQDSECEELEEENIFSLQNVENNTNS